MQQLIELERKLLIRKEDFITSRASHLPKKPDGPTIRPESTDGDCAIFLDSWNHYKEMCGLTEPAVLRNEQRTACVSEVNRLLFDLVGAETLNSTTEEQLLQQIKLVAVRGLHKKVYRQGFYSMGQKEGESDTHFLVRLRSLAKFCDF